MSKANDQNLLLSREAFREGVFARDGHACVICGRTEVDGIRLDAHHIIERRLFREDGGYYLNNGATLCDEGEDGCHYRAETTELSVEDVRLAAGIDRPVIPDELYSDHVYDKWGNGILEDGRRSRGPLFGDESVMKVLGARVDLFTPYVKYGRTPHLPWSPGITDDDRIHKDMAFFAGKECVATRKMDGESFTGYVDYCHARSIDGRSHPSRDWVKNFWAQRSYELPEWWRVCCENVYAKHSIGYDNLPGYLLGFSIWNEANICLDWDQTVEWFELLDIPMVEVLWRGVYDEKAIKALYDESRDWDTHEGYVLRTVEGFHYRDFGRHMAKYVRAKHVQTVKHWMHGQAIVPNGLADT